MANCDKVLTALIDNGHKYRCYGIMTDDRVLQVGDEPGNSHDLWWDSEDYGEELSGTCATGFGYLWYDEDDMDEVEKALKIQESYQGDHQYLIAGDDFSYGDDAAEIIIRNAVVVAVIR